MEDEKAVIAKRIDEYEAEGIELAKDIKALDPKADGLTATMAMDVAKNLAGMMRHALKNERYEKGEIARNGEGT